MDNFIYFAVGFKSFDIERISGTSGIWFEWTERSRKAVTTTTFNKGSMEWIVRVHKEASQTKGNSVRRWRKTDDIAEIFGWADIAEKVARFISAHKTTNNLEAYRTVDENIPYAEMRKGGVNANAEVTMQKGVISIKEPICNHSEALKRSLVGKFNANATLTESIQLAQQVMEGIWEWKKTPVKLIWWNPLVATVEERSTGKSTWVKILGLPLHLWSQKIFKAIGNLCGGWVETEEETTLRNHLKWARIRVCSDGNNIPREVKVENGGVVDQDPLDKGMWTDMGQLKGTRPSPHALPCDSQAESSGVRNRANVDGLSMLDPKVILGLTPKTQGESTNTAANQAESREAELQIQQIHQPEPVDMLNPIEPEVNSHILELSNTYGVAFEGFESETLELLMRIDERKMEIDKTKQPKETTTPKSRGRGKNELKNLQSSLNKEVEGMVVDGSKGGILLMWDSRVWKGSKVEEGNFSITYKFEALPDSFCWTFTGVYAPHTRKEKLECWEEMAAMKGLSKGPWVTGGDFNTVRHMLERRGCSRTTNIMADFSKWIEDLELHDPILIGGKYTWVRGLNHQSNARLDGFLYLTEWEESFKNIRQRIMPRVTSDHNPILLECGDREKRNSYFKFENWWLKVEGFNELVREWWNGFTVVGTGQSYDEERWRQKFKALWLKEGDKNTRFFQRLATAHRRYNTIDRLAVRGEEMQELDEIKSAMIEFYSNLYTENEPWRPTFDLTGCPIVTNEENEWLQRPFTETEVLQTIQQCDGDKAPSPDGYTLKFFKACWEILKEDLMQTIHNFHQKGVFEKCFNATLVALAPKKPGAVELEDF
ncbi:hypothetical protein H5410_030937 [Solanum commersonii]|uniref:DUF4283 domain-containing protein n=1 Tax=Solanum commersonii TaxID=4109 RepID=A0A9J5YIE1_SOLCO|nr:hypothetical protein H5410_030937 [Solanum commersonii]